MQDKFEDKVTEIAEFTGFAVSEDKMKVKNKIYPPITITIAIDNICVFT